MSRPAPLLALFVALIALAGCKDKGKESAAEAATNVKLLVETTEKDVAEVDRGLPEGAKKIAEILTKELGKDADPKTNGPAVKSALLKMRRDVPDLGIAKSTFFALADDKGIAVRNDLEQDTMAGKDLVGAWPGLRPALAGGYVSTTGQFPGVPSQFGADKEWVAAMPVKRADGSLMGLLVTGWTYRRFAFHLQDVVKRDLQGKLMREGDKGKLPILYVALFDKEHVYGAAAPGSPPFPPVNEKALEELNLLEKTAAGPAEGAIKITERDFGWAAARAPKLGADLGVVLLRSEI
jgi:hypothetical protein